MDPRKQKRLGAAPIASFEKSLDDGGTPAHVASYSSAVGAPAPVSMNQHAPASAPLPGSEKNANGFQEAKMETHGSYTKQSRTTPPIAATAAATIRNNSETTATKTMTQQKPKQKIGTTGDGSSSGEIAKFRRPPPLKTATATTTTTLVSSCEQQISYKGATTLTTPSTPRIELSRASSSSHHDDDDEEEEDDDNYRDHDGNAGGDGRHDRANSRDSSPENVFEQETIGLGFREEGALELRTSTEELYFMDPAQKRAEQEKIQQQIQYTKRSSPHIFRFEDHQTYLQQHQRKDSASSEVAALLCISGRTSRISSVGSQGSAVSRLSAVSGVSRSPSPHRMLLETSFCGPKPLENVVDGRTSITIEAPTAELFEQVILSRKHDPTQAVLAEGIKLESSPRKKPTSLSNGDSKLAAKIAAQNKPSTIIAKASTMGAQRRSTKSPGQMVVGKTPSGTEYIRINLKPDHMYEDKGIGPNERIVEAPNTLAPVYARSQKKPVSLSLGRNTMDENRLTPTASPKPSRHGAASKDAHGSRSPSPATTSVSRKSSFSSLFRLGGKDSPDSPRERTRSRSKSKDRQTPQSQNVTPSKQKSVLAIFKPGKRGSSAGAEPKTSKTSSPSDVHELQQSRSKSQTPVVTATGSRPASRLRYYDEPVEGVIHIPLHTPPEEKETRKLLDGIQQLNTEPVRAVSASITASQLAAAAAALKPVGSRKATGVRPPQIEKLQRLENLDAIHSLPSDDPCKDGSWGLEANRNNSQDSQETVGSETSYACAIKMGARTTLPNVKENVVQENGMAAEAEVHRLPSVDSQTSVCEAKVIETIATVTRQVTQMQQKDAMAKEKRRLLFATRLGSGSQEQVFSTQFSISKTESQSSQLSDQMADKVSESSDSEYLHRQGTVIRRSEDEIDDATASTPIAKGQAVKHQSSAKNLDLQRQKSLSTSEDEKPSVVQTTVAAVVMRRKDSGDEVRPKSRSTSEDDVDPTAGSAGHLANQRHSRYLENFDIRKKYQDNMPRKPKRQSISESFRTDMVESAAEETATTQQEHFIRKPTLPQPPPPSTAPSPSPPPTVHSNVTSRSATPPTRAVPRSQSQSPKPTPTKPPRTTTPTRRTQSPTPTSPTPVASHSPSPSPSAAASASPSQVISPQVTKKSQHQQQQHQAYIDRQSVHSTDEPVESSESERDSELTAAPSGSSAIDPKRRHLPHHVGVIEDHESTGLVSQESFDDELPYIPTTLPEERAQGVALIPMKDRANMELKTYSVDRPRSTTPLNPSHLEEYYGIVAPHEVTYELSGSAPVRGEKLRISLPRKDSTKDKAQNSKSPRCTPNAGGKSWFEFAEEGLRATGSNVERKDYSKQPQVAAAPQLQQQLQQQPHQQPQLQPQPQLQMQSQAHTNEELKTNIKVGKTITTTAKTTAKTATVASSGTSTQRKLSGHWIDFENIPEKRKPPKRITTLPKEVSSASKAQHHAAATTDHEKTNNHHGHHHASSHGAHAHQHEGNVSGNGDGQLTHYNYVKPEECQCECHEVDRDNTDGGTVPASVSDAGTVSKSLADVDLLRQGEDLLPLLDTQDGIEPSDSSREYSCYTDDEMDVPMRHSGSSRSKSSSSKMDEFPRRDVSRSPRNRKFPDNRM